MKKEKECRYFRGKGPKSIHCSDGCFVKFMSARDRQRFYASRCLGRPDKCNVHNALAERERRGGGTNNA